MLIIIKKINHIMKNSIAMKVFRVANVAVKTAKPPQMVIIIAWWVNVFTGYGVLTSRPISMLVIMNRYISWGNKR